jgi:hypothetical protein
MVEDGRKRVAMYLALRETCPTYVGKTHRRVGTSYGWMSQVPRAGGLLLVDTCDMCNRCVGKPYRQRWNFARVDE